MVTVGITGGIGSGKTTVCKIWSRMGAYVLNADDLAKQLMVSDTEIKEQLIETFGEASYFEDGSLNKEHLAFEAFEKDRVEELNAIVHPRLPDAASKKMRKVEQTGYDVFVYEAALLLENIEPDDLDYIVLVLADEEDRLKRVLDRDNSSEKEVRQRMDKQRDFAKATDRADFIILNNGSLEELEKKAEVMYQNFLDTEE